MSPLERQELTNITRAMTTEQKKAVVRHIPNGILEEELKRRYDAEAGKIEALFQIIENTEVIEDTLQAMTDFVNSIQKAVM